MSVRSSYGIILIRYFGEQRRPEVLLVCRRYTYAFYDFCNGYYRVSQPLFDKMSIDEKLDIYKGNFERMWYRMWPSESTTSSKYIRAFKKFQKEYDNGDRIKRMILSSCHSILTWEPPKGRKSSKESEYDCAIREFIEETAIPRDQIKIIPGVEAILSNTADDITYTTKYFAAVATEDIIPLFSFASSSQLQEISDVRWWPVEALKVIAPSMEISVRMILKKLKAIRKRS